MSTLQEKDLKYIFHPCSQMKDYETLLPMVITKGEGVYLYDEFGNKYMDCVSSWWVNLFGHCNPRINKALASQLNTLEHVIFANFSHKAAIDLGEELCAVAPSGLNKLIFSENGSSAIEIALKISFQYHQEKGFKDKLKFVSLKNAYHGETLGALGVTDVSLFTSLYKPLINEAIKVQGPDCSHCCYCPESCQAQCFEAMENVLNERHPEISGVVIEPIVQGAAGMKIYSPVYLTKLRELTKKLNIHLIADEIAVGFGRTGKMFACEHAGISPDIMCVGKGLTAGYFPMSITMITDEIYDAFYDDYLKGRSFLHSHSYSGNPLGCAVAVETLKIFREENILETVNSKGEYLKKRTLEIFKDHPNISEFRNIGFIGALELIQDKEKKLQFPHEERAGFEIYKIGLKNGVIIRPLGNTIYFMPPYTMTLEEIDFMLDTCLKSLNQFILNRSESAIKHSKPAENFINFEV